MASGTAYLSRQLQVFTFGPNFVSTPRAFDNTSNLPGGFGTILIDEVLTSTGTVIDGQLLVF